MERTPGWNSRQRKGPVPTAVVKSVVPSLTIWKWKVPSTTGRSAFGASSVMRTSSGPVAAISVIGMASDRARDAVAGSLWRVRGQEAAARGERLALAGVHAPAPTEGANTGALFAP